MGRRRGKQDPGKAGGGVSSPPPPSSTAGQDGFEPLHPFLPFPRGRGEPERGGGGRRMPCPEPINYSGEESHLPYFLSAWKLHRFPSCSGELRSQEFQQSHDLFPGSCSIWWRGARANYRHRKKGRETLGKALPSPQHGPGRQHPQRQGESEAGASQTSLFPFFWKDKNEHPSRLIPPFLCAPARRGSPTEGSRTRHKRRAGCRNKCEKQSHRITGI